MNERVTIEPVAWRRRAEAIRFVAAGAADDEIADVRAGALRQLVEQRGRNASRIWWARREDQCVAAAVVLEGAGRTGMLLHTPPAAPGVDVELLVMLSRGICQAALESGLSLVQALVEPQDHRDRELLRSAGLQRLARLLYLRRELTGAETAAPDPTLMWRRYGQFDERELGELILRTYEGSADCPLLCGVRRSEDIIAGHKACGRFQPESWWIVDRNGEAAGCILVNDSAAQISEIVYMGLVREHRGRGLGAAMVAYALADAARRGRVAMDVAMDDANRYAGRLYDAAGFRRRDAREAWVMLHKSQFRHSL